MNNTLKVGDLVYTKNVGYPFNRTDDGGDSWEGASCIVIELNTGANKRMVNVEALIPIKIRPRDFMETCLFYPEQLVKEDRPWLAKHLNAILSFKTKVNDMADFCERLSAKF